MLVVEEVVVLVVDVGAEVVVVVFTGAMAGAQDKATPAMSEMLMAGTHRRKADF